MKWLTQIARWSRATEQRFIWVRGVVFWGSFMTAGTFFLESQHNVWELIPRTAVFGIGGYVWGWSMWRRGYRALSQTMSNSSLPIQNR